MLKAIIIDDEPDARKNLRFLIAESCPAVELIGEANGVASGIQEIEKRKPNLVFLDIQMEDGNGFDLLDAFPNPAFLVVFITAFNDFAVKAFRYSAIDYLLKPTSSNLLMDAVNKVKEKMPGIQFKKQIDHLMQLSSTKQFDRIVLPSTEGLIFVQIEQIRRMEADGSYTKVYTLNGEVNTVSKSLKEFETLLASPPFCRIHQSHLINLKCVKKFLREDGGYALMDDGSKVMVARRRKDYFIKLMTANEL